MSSRIIALIALVSLTAFGCPRGGDDTVPIPDTDVDADTDTDADADADTDADADSVAVPWPASLEVDDAVAMIASTSGDYHFAYTVAVAGDLDGDGSDDVVIGTAEHGGAEALGVYSGALTGDHTDQEAISWLDTSPWDSVNAATVLGGEDIDGDGDIDLLIGAPYGDSGAYDESGTIRPAFRQGPTFRVGCRIRGDVFSGYMGTRDTFVLGRFTARAGLGVLSVDQQGTTDASWYLATPPIETDDGQACGCSGGQSAREGDAVAAWDQDGDGLDELVIEVTPTDGTSVEYIAVANEEDIARYGSLFAMPGPRWVQSTNVMLGRGDVTGDGQDDLLVATPASAEYAAVYVYAGGTTPDPARPFARLESPEGSVESMAHVTDIDADGVIDLAIGIADAAGGRGAVYLFALPLGGDETSVADADAVILGPADTRRFGHVTSMGDLDGDGIPDLVAARPWYSSSDVGIIPGAAWIFRGPTQ